MHKPKRKNLPVDKAVIQDLLSFVDSDAGNAEAFEFLHGYRFRYNHTSGNWLVWNGRYWMEDQDGEALRATLDVIRLRQIAAITIDDDTLKKRRIKWAIESEANWKRMAMLRSAQTIHSLTTTAEQYDRDPFLLTVANGTVDLRTGELRSSRPEDLITRATSVSYTGEAHAPRWIQFLDEVFAGDAELISFIQRAIGYTLTGDTSEQCFFVLLGGGANGKSTFVETLCKVLGSHAETAEFSTFLVRGNSGSPRNDVARLQGARFVKASEGEHQARLAESIVKQLTGEDSVAARYLYHELFTFQPQFKLWLITNHKPEIRGTDKAIWRRVRLVPFDEQFEGPSRDARLREKLEMELPGILSWAVRGCLMWQKDRLGMAPRVERATKQYRQESDQVGRFLAERCSSGSGFFTEGQKLYEAYLEWCLAKQEKPETNAAFAKNLAERQISKKRRRRGVIYQGLSLLTDPRDPPHRASRPELPRSGV
jgi:putative DNA primase/helicase